MLIAHAARQLRASSRGAPSAALRAALSARLITSTAPVRASLVDNPNLADLAGNDYLYHIGLNPAQQDLHNPARGVGWEGGMVRPPLAPEI